MFGSIQLPGEIIRLLVAFLGVGVAAYYDLFRERNIPNNYLYGFLVAALLIDLIFYSEKLFLFSLGLAVFFGGIGYIFYRLGQIGGADVIIIAALNLLLPIHPSLSNMTINIPFIFSVLIYSGVFFSLHVLGFFGKRMYERGAKPKYIYLLLLIPFLVFAWVYANSFIFSPIYLLFITILFLASLLFLMFKEEINEELTEEVPLSQIQEEDVAALELMDKDFVEKFKIPRLLRKKDIERLKEEGVDALIIYTKLPPFVPFLLVGMIFGVLFGNALLI